jgi:gliding motility-associated-like protein
MNKIILFVVIVFQVSFSFGQTDTLFWFVAPEVAQSHGDRPIVLRFATLNTAATITISQPANPAFPVQIINLGINAAQTLDLTAWVDITENKPPNMILPFGFKIVSTTPIMAYYEVTPSCNCNPDIFTLKGKNSLGTQFIVPFQNFLNNAAYARSGFDIVATQNNTTVTINPKNDIVGHPANVPFVIILQKGETYSAQAVSTSAGLHLSGSTVVADKPIAITIVDDSMSGAPYGGCADLMGDQIIPISVTGKEHITIKGYLNGPDKVYIVATQNNTQVTIDGVNVAILNITDMYVHTQTNATAYTQTDKPVYVLHTSGFGCEVGGAIVPPIVCTGSNTVAFVRSTNEFFAINILVPTGGENTFTLNGSPANIGPGIFQPVPGTAGAWKYAQIDGTPFIGVQQASRVENPNSKFHLGVIHGGSSSGCRYGYFSDFAAYKYEIESNASILCSGDTLALTTDSLPGATYNWTGPLGINSNGINLQLLNVVPAQSGNYIISGFTAGSCELIPDTVAIIIIATPPLPGIITNSPLCFGDTLFVSTNASSFFSFDWIFNDTLNLQGSNFNLSALSPGNYTVSLVSSLGNCISPINQDTIVVFNPNSIQYAGPSDTCGNAIGFLSSYQTDPSDPMASITWYDANNIMGSGQTLNNITATNGAYSTQTYWVELTTQNNCTAADTFSITFNPYPAINLSLSPLCDGETATYTTALAWSTITPPNINCTYFINYGDGQTGTNANGTHIYDSIGNYTVIVSATSSEDCPMSDTANVIITSIPQLIPQVTPQCGQVADFSAEILTGNYVIDQLYWTITGIGDFNTQEFTTTFTSPGNYIGTLFIEGENGCDFNTPLLFTIIPSVTIENLEIPNVLTPNNDGINDVLTINSLFVDCTEFTLYIINRWGNLVYEMNNQSLLFKGEDQNGNKLEQGVYFYRLITNDGREAVGHITIL